MAWRQGEHVAIIGDTGSGKTYLETRLLKLREYVVVLRTKDDDTRFRGFRRVKKAANVAAADGQVELFPRYERQRVECARMLERAWREGGWCVAVDELYYLEQQLHLRPYVERLLTQGRGKRVSVVVGAQRPSGITRFALSQVTHLFIFHSEGRDLKEVIARSTTDAIVAPVRGLREHEYVYWNRRTRRMVIAKAQSVAEVLR